jgi:hypothetical protein
MKQLFKFKYGEFMQAKPAEEKPSAIVYNDEGLKLSANKSLYRNSPFAQQFWAGFLGFTPDLEKDLFEQVLEKWEIFYNKHKAPETCELLNFDYSYTETEYGQVNARRTVIYTGNLSLDVDEIVEIWDDVGQDGDDFENAIRERCRELVNDNYYEGYTECEDYYTDYEEWSTDDSDFDEMDINYPDCDALVERYCE